MAILSIAEIMAAEDITTEEVPVEEWGGSVLCRSISHRTMRNIKKKVQAEREDGEASDDDIEKWVFIEGMVEPQISEEEFEHLLDKSTAAMNKILAAIMGKSKAEEKSIKEQEKSFPDGSSGVLPVPTSGEATQDSAGTLDGDTEAPESR